jgi:sugar phosphate permease
MVSALAKLRALPRTVWALGVVSLLTDAAADMIYPLLPSILERVGASVVSLGVMEGIAEAVSAIVKVASGHAADRARSPKRLVAIGYGLSSIARPLMAFAHGSALIVVLRTFDRLGKGIRGAPRDKILARAAPPTQRGLAFGVHRGMDNLGAVIGGALSFVLLGAFALPLDTVLLLSFIPGLLSTLVAVTFVEAKETALEPARVALDGEGPAVERPRVPPEARRAIAVFGAFALAASADSFLVAHLTKLGLPIALAPLAWISLQLAKSLLNVPGGALADRLGPKVVVAGSYAVYAGAYVAFAFVRSPWAFWALLPVYALYYGFGEGAERSLLVNVAPEAVRGRTLGWANAVQGLMLLPANIGFGLVYVWEPRAAFLMTAAIAAAAAVALAIGVRPPARA